MQSKMQAFMDEIQKAEEQKEKREEEKAKRKEEREKAKIEPSKLKNINPFLPFFRSLGTLDRIFRRINKTSL